MKRAAGNSRERVKKQILIVDDHPMVREGLAQLIAREPELAVCGEAGTAQEGLAKAAELKPDLILVDITLPGRSGLELIKDILAIRPETRVLVVSMHEESLYAERVLRAGGRGYIMKQEGGRKLVEAIRQVLAGQVYVSPSMSARLLDSLSGARAQDARSPVEGLTDREFEIFRLIGEGLSTRDIAQKLHLSVKTIEVHRLNIKTKLKLASSSELVHRAVRWMQAQTPGAV
ncbi:MAG: response regulator transcription factor [Verrucomicrobia subdivision 3 bacterium]|nr:response regulator transcription factor [Limisphaerales bacterium]